MLFLRLRFLGASWRADQLRYQMPAQDIQLFKQQTNETKFVRDQQRKAQIKPQLCFTKTVTRCYQASKVKRS